MQNNMFSKWMAEYLSLARYLGHRSTVVLSLPGRLMFKTGLSKGQKYSMVSSEEKSH